MNLAYTLNLIDETAYKYTTGLMDRDTFNKTIVYIANSLANFPSDLGIKGMQSMIASLKAVSTVSAKNPNPLDVTDIVCKYEQLIQREQEIIDQYNEQMKQYFNRFEGTSVCGTTGPVSGTYNVCIGYSAVTKQPAEKHTMENHWAAPKEAKRTRSGKVY